MIMATVVGVAAAFGCAVAGWMAAPRLAGFGDRPSGWLDRRLAAVLSAVGGGCAAALSGGPVAMITFTALAVGCVWLALVDLATQRLPDRLVGPLIAIALLGLACTAIGYHQPARMLITLITGTAVLSGYFVLGLVTGRLGLGDVKLAGLIGLVLGWAGPSQTAFGALAGFAVGAVVATGLLVFRRADRKADFPFGPAMIIGAALGLAFGPAAFPGL